jgi:hypothetical protein
VVLHSGEWVIANHVVSASSAHTNLCKAGDCHAAALVPSDMPDDTAIGNRAGDRANGYTMDVALEPTRRPQPNLVVELSDNGGSSQHPQLKKGDLANGAAYRPTPSMPD